MKKLLLILLCVPLLFSNCNKDDDTPGNNNNNNNNSALAIGDTHLGGIVFYLDGNGGGLIAAPTDHPTLAEWGCWETSAYAHGTAIGTGNDNTISIVEECSSTETAADICANRILGGYSDWFLPSKDELNEMYLNIGQGNALGLGNIGGFANNVYWSSTEDGSLAARSQYFSTGYQNSNTKTNDCYVRAVRSF